MMWKRKPTVWALALAAGVPASGCTDSAPTVPRDADAPAPIEAARSAAGQDAPWTMDARFARVATQVPGFGGLFFDESGTLVVYQSGAHPLSGGDLARALAEIGVDVATHPMTIRAAQFGWQELHEVHTRISPVVLGLADVVYTDADEARNRVVVAVADAAAAARVEHALAMLDVPRDAVIVEVTEPIRFMQTLQNHRRPVAGGLQIDGGGSLCTLTVNVRFVGDADRYFMTPSHCSQVHWGLDDTHFAQPLASHSRGHIGTEAKDATGAGLCPPPTRCRYSDAAFARYNGPAGTPTPDALGRIYRTTGIGSIQIDPAQPLWEIVAAGPPFVGTVVHKVGRTTGHTTGVVTATCVTSFPDANMVLLCQDLASGPDGFMAGGDSGAPVFEIVDGSGVRLRGQAWGGTSNSLAFSSLSNIQQDYPAEPFVVF